MSSLIRISGPRTYTPGHHVGLQEMTPPHNQGQPYTLCLSLSLVHRPRSHTSSENLLFSFGEKADGDPWKTFPSRWKSSPHFSKELNQWYENVNLYWAAKRRERGRGREDPWGMREERTNRQTHGATRRWEGEGVLRPPIVPSLRIQHQLL